MLIIGIDPGFQGAVGVLDVAQTSMLTVRALVFDAPIMVLGAKKPGGKVKEKPVFSQVTMFRLLKAQVDTQELCVAAIEEVGPRPMEGVVASFRFGAGYGMWTMALAALGIMRYEIPSMRWKRDVFATRGQDKDASVIKAEQLFPSLVFRTERGRLLDGRAEALLLADYLRRQLAQGKL